jgi:hypothetical protein
MKYRRNWDDLNLRQPLEGKGYWIFRNHLTGERFIAHARHAFDAREEFYKRFHREPMQDPKELELNPTIDEDAAEIDRIMANEAKKPKRKAKRRRKQ